jgi:hypothetical protein
MWNRAVTICLELAINSVITFIFSLQKKNVNKTLHFQAEENLASVDL